MPLHAGESLSASPRDSVNTIELPTVPDKLQIMQWLLQNPDAINHEPAANLETVSVQAPRQLTGKGVQLQVQQGSCISLPFSRQPDEMLNSMCQEPQASPTTQAQGQQQEETSVEGKPDLAAKCDACNALCAVHEQNIAC